MEPLEPNKEEEKVFLPESDEVESPQPDSDESISEEPIVDASKSDEIKDKEPVADENDSDEPVVDESKAEQPVLDEVVPEKTIPEVGKSTDVLRPETVGVKPQQENEEVTVPLLKSRNFWKNVVVIAVCVVLIGLIAGGVGYFIGKEKSSKETTRKSKKTSVTASDDTEKTKKTKTSSGKESSDATTSSVDVNYYNLRAICAGIGMTVMDTTSYKEFTAVDPSLKLIVTVELSNGKTLDDLVTEMIAETTPLDSSKITRTDNTFLYEGYQNKDDPTLGYCFLDLIHIGDHYIFVQGLGDHEGDSVIPQARNLSASIRQEVGIA